MIPTVNPKDWPNILEMVEKFIIEFRGIYGQPFSYGLSDDLEPPAATSDPMHRANGSKYFTNDEDIITCGLIISVTLVLGSDPEAVGPFSDSFIIDRSLIWEKLVTIFQGSDAWTHLKPPKKHCD